MKLLFRTCLAVVLSCHGFVSVPSIAATSTPEKTEPQLFGSVIPIEIELGPTQVRQLKSNPRSYVEAKLTIAGVSLDRIGIHLKGAVGSFQPLEQKPSLTLDLDRFQTGQSVGGCRKLHLNNSVEDPSFLNEWLGNRLFREAGFPTPYVGHARVRLNGRTLGLYVLKEGFSRDVLRRSFPHSSGTLLEPDPRQDVRGKFRIKVGNKDSTAHETLRELARVLDEPDLARRKEHLDRLLNRDFFARFLAMEVLLGHRDGYALARNNYRIYVSAAPTSIVFLPHGMDQLLQSPKSVANPFMAGDVARSWMEIPENEQLYAQTLEDLNSRLLAPTHVSQLLEDVWSRIRDSLRISESQSLRQELDSFQVRSRERHQFLSDHFAQPKPVALEFHGSKVKVLGWKPGKGETGTVTGSAEGGKNPSDLKLTLNSPGWVSTETVVVLHPGRYRFRGRIRVEGFQDLPFGKHQGASLRVAGTEIRSKDTHRADSPKPIEVEFEIPGDKPQTKTLVCELRGQSGTAWVDLDSLEIEEITPPKEKR